METYLMNVATGTVDTYENWKAEWKEAKKAGQLEELGWEPEWEDNLSGTGLVEVVRNYKNSVDYNPDYGDWQPV